MLHRAIFGSLERFFGVLIESTAGTKCILTLTLTNPNPNPNKP